jgi:hypothetical protein
MPNNISKPLAFGEHAVCITNTSIHSFGELVDCLQLSLFPFSLTEPSLIIYIRKYLNGLPFQHSALDHSFLCLLLKVHYLFKKLTVLVCGGWKQVDAASVASSLGFAVGI